MAIRWGLDPERRHLLRDGRPWFLLGDTAWELLHRLTKDEATHYLRTRAEQGFNTVLTVALAELDGLDEPNAEGHRPFVDGDPRRPVAAYWDHVDWCLDTAAGLGLTVGLLPTWGCHWHEPDPRRGTVTFDAGRALDYARGLRDRYRNADLFWVLGGDRMLATPEQVRVIEAFAEGVRGDQLITYHPGGRASSSEAFPDADWLDFDLIQSGHTGWTTPNDAFIEQEYARGVRPILDGEPNYENHPVMTPSWSPVEGCWFDDRDVRRAAYHAVFAGACGHVYGCHDVWQCYDPDRRTPVNRARTGWQAALTLPGAAQAGLLGRFAAAVELSTWRPDQGVIAAGGGFLGTHQRALVRADGTLVYAPAGRAVTLVPAFFDGGTGWTADWWDPRTGTWTEPVSGIGPAPFAHPFPGDDGVLRVRR